MKKLYFLILLCCGYAFAQPDINANPTPLTQCDAGNGTATFNLETAVPSILQGQSPALFAITFHHTLLEAQNDENHITGTTAYTSLSGTENLFVRVEDFSDGMYAIANLALFTSSLPTATISANAANVCLGNPASFTIHGSGGTLPYLFNYQVNGGPIQALVSNASDATVSLPSDQLYSYTILLTQITSGANCITPLNESVSINIVQPALAFPVSDFVSETSPNTGFSTFDLTSLEPAIVGGQTGVSVSFYLSQSEAELETDAIGTPQAYANVSNPQTIWARVQSANSDCAAYTSFHLAVSDPGIVYIPDVAFKAALLANYDANFDGEIQYSEAAAVATLTVDNLQIADLTGIKSFTSLINLYAMSNSLTTVDLSGMPALRLAYLGENAIASINLNNIDSLRDLVLDQNQLTQLVLGDKPNLDRFSAMYNHISYLDLGNLPLLREINVFGNELVSLNVNAFQNLQLLSCSSNHLTQLDFNQAAALKSVYCSTNALSQINASGLSNLETLYFDENPIQSHSWSGLPNLKNLNFGNTAISDFDFPANVNLLTLDCRSNGITTLNVSGFPSLTNLDCRLNQLSAIDVSPLHFLNFLNCSGNHIGTLDLNANAQLQSISIADNNMQFLYAKNGATEQFSATDFSNNNLVYICEDEAQVAVVQALAGSGTTVNSYCTFVPGGVFDRITGTVGFDIEGNGCDASDAAGPFLKVRLVDGNQTYDVFTNQQSVYDFYVGNGTYSVNPVLENNYFTVSPNVSSVNFATADGSVSNNDFCVTANGSNADAEIAIVPIVAAQPGLEAIYEVVIRNKGNQVLSQASGVSLQFNENLLDFVSSNVVPSNLNSGLVSWDYLNLQPFESRRISVKFQVNSPADTPAVNTGDHLAFTAHILAAADVAPLDNDFLYNQTVVSAYDPNNKQCLQGEVVSTSAIGNYLYYAINFENTGTAPAQNVVITDDLNPAMFDRNTVQILSSSHDVKARVSAQGIVLIFEAASVDSGGHGNILLRVRTRGDLQAGSTVSNKADIYFDYNAAIETNTAHTTFQDLSVNNPKDASVQLYPNPVSDSFTVKATSDISSLQLFDMRGRLLQVKTVGAPQTTFDMSNRAAAVYFVKITTQKGTRIEKVVKN